MTNSPNQTVKESAEKIAIHRQQSKYEYLCLGDLWVPHQHITWRRKEGIITFRKSRLTLTGDEKWTKSRYAKFHRTVCRVAEGSPWTSTGIFNPERNLFGVRLDAKGIIEKFTYSFLIAITINKTSAIYRQCHKKDILNFISICWKLRRQF